MHTRQAWMVGGWALVTFVIVCQGINGRQDSTPGSPAPAKPASQPQRDLSKLPPLQRQMEISAQCGAEWLFRANRPDGRFVNGHIPALQKVMETDDYLRQTGATIALARAGRHIGNERYLARARQAMLVLLLDTEQATNDPAIRYTTLPPTVVNRIAAAGMLLLAIHELPDPGTDLLEQAEQLSAYLARQQKSDGSFLLNAAADADQPAAANAPSEYVGLALAGLMRNHIQRPASWKLDTVRNALGFYRRLWRSRKDVDFVPWSIAAFADAHVQTKDPACADFVLEMADWLCELQYARLDPRHPMSTGGFMSVANGKPNATEPTVISAAYAHALADACRVAKLKGDAQRFVRYRAALTGCLQFVFTLQYTDANTTHFTDGYKPNLLGGFHLSHQDGNLWLDYTQWAVCALIHALNHVTD